MAPPGDHTAFSAFVRRILRAYARRVALADPEDLAELLAVQADVTTAIDNAVRGLRANGYTWADIATATGTTRQNAHKRWRHVEDHHDTGTSTGPPDVIPRLTPERAA